MHFNILTIFSEMFPGTLGAGVVGRALEKGLWSYDTVNIRDFAINNYGSVDDEQFGGGVGMVMRPDVLGNAIDSVQKRGKIIYFSPRGPTLNQGMVRDFARDKDATYTLLCGRYEGIDQRVIDEYDITELSIGDYILSGGEVAAQVFIDSVVRVLDNVLGGGTEATANESFEIGGPVGMAWTKCPRSPAVRSSRQYRKMAETTIGRNNKKTSSGFNKGKVK